MKNGAGIVSWFIFSSCPLSFVEVSQQKNRACSVCQKIPMVDPHQKDKLAGLIRVDQDEG